MAQFITPGGSREYSEAFGRQRREKEKREKQDGKEKGGRRTRGKGKR